MSEGQDGDSPGGDDDTPPRVRTSGKPKSRQRSGDVGRALRTVYDDTLRESVPDDFLDLLGKLS
ncbi:MAG: NepR family anti-sigma factor [Sphingomicrobium sp.]